MYLRILYLCQYFPPEVGATQSRAWDMTAFLKEQGHYVTVITEFPNHPSGIVPPEYRNKLFQRETMNGLDVIRVWVRASPKKNFFNRILFYLTYSMSAVVAGLFLRAKYDIIFATSPPLFTALSGLVLHKLKIWRFVLEIRDLWPESAISLGELSGKNAIKAAEWIENKCYQYADQIITVTEGVRKKLYQRGIPEAKLSLIENGADTRLFRFDKDARIRIRSELGWENTLGVVYAGTLGIAQGLETILEAAHLLNDSPDFQFLLVGEGPVKEKLVQLAVEWNLHRIAFLPEIPRDLIPGYLSAADLALIPLRNRELFKNVVPSKLFDAWACECPVILGVDGEARHLLDTCQGGYFVSPEDPNALVDALRKAKEDIRSLHTMGKRARIYTEQHYSRQAQAKVLESLLQAVVRKP